jgi:hypothetical protein
VEQIRRRGGKKRRGGEKGKGKGKEKKARRKKRKNKRRGEKRKKYSQGQFRLFTISIQLVKPFCQTFSKTAPTPLEKPLHQQSRSRSRSRFWRSRSPAKQALILSRG